MEKAIKPKVKKVEVESSRYFEGVGRRKTAAARARFRPDVHAKDKDLLTVNGLKYTEYFKVPRYQMSAITPLKLLKLDSAVEAKVYGGGTMAQAEAVSLGIARAIIKWTPSFKATLSAAGLLTRDSRMVERKKPGLRKARRAHQWKKR